MSEPYFDMEWIVKLLIEIEPDRVDLINQLRKSERKKWIRQPYVILLPDELLNQSGLGWQIEESVVLEHPEEGTIVIDILNNGQIRGIEFLNQIF